MAGVLALSICGAPRAALAAVPPPCGPLASAPPLPLPTASAPAAPLLRHLAAHLTAVPADAQTGRYTRLGLDMSAADSSIGDCVETVTAVATETRWRDEIVNSGQVTGVAWHTRGTPTPRTQTTVYVPGDLPGVLTGRAPADPRRLAAALDAVYPPEAVISRSRARLAAAIHTAGMPAQTRGTAGRVRAVGDLFRWHDTPLPVRRGILTALADVAGLVAHGPVTVAGRSGLAVSVTDGTSRYVLIIDAASGQVIAAEDVLIDRTIAANLAVTAPYSLARTLLTDRGRTARLGR